MAETVQALEYEKLQREKLFEQLTNEEGSQVSAVARDTRGPENQRRLGDVVWKARIEKLERFIDGSIDIRRRLAVACSQLGTQSSLVDLQEKINSFVDRLVAAPPKGAYPISEDCAIDRASENRRLKKRIDRDIRLLESEFNLNLGTDLNSGVSINADTEGVSIFISHSSTDASVAEALADLFRNALSVPPDKIRCTSVLAYSLPFGVDATESLRNEVSTAGVVVGLVTPSSAESHWVLFELGARWGLRKPLFSVLAAGASYDMLPGPIRSHHALQVNAAEPAGVVKIVEEVAAQLKIPCLPSFRYQKFTDAFIGVACRSNVTGSLPKKQPAPESILEAFKKRYRYEQNVCWKYDENGKRIDGPFCPNCVDEGKERRLNPLASKGYYGCVVHSGATFKTDGQAPPLYGPRRGIMQ